MTTLRKGSRGAEVKQLQTILGIKADGIFGAITLDTVKAFQKANNLAVDGIVGVNTWRVLLGEELHDIVIPCEDLKQYASPHGTMVYGKDSSWGTYKSGGCGAASFAIVCRAYGLAPIGETSTQTIQRLGKYAVDKGYRIKGNGTSASLFNTNGLNRYGTTSASKLECALREGKLVILHIGKGYGNGYQGDGHYCVAYGIKSADVLIRDVGSSATSRQKVALSKLTKNLKNGYIMTKDG